MKEKIIETAGKTWKTLGENGESEITQLPRILNEKDGLVYQALGWLAREDKINYTTKNNKTFVSLVAPELEAFKRFIGNQTTSQENQTTNKRRRLLL